MTQKWVALDRLREEFIAPVVTQSHICADETKLVKIDLRKCDADHIEISHLTDLQYGHRNFLREKFLTYRDWILSSPVRYCVLGGDLIDAATVLSVGSPYENTAEPIDQVSQVVALLAPLAEGKRILGYVGGNHERRTIATFGDVGRLIAKQLGVPYSRGVQHIDIWFGEHAPFKMSVWHGSGHARTKGAKAQMLHRFMGQADSQVYLVGHLHDAFVLFDWRHRRKGGRIQTEKIAGIMSSSFLDYWNSYAETAALAPSGPMMGRVILECSGKWEVTMR